MKTTDSTKGTLTSFTIHAPQLGRDRTVWVYLPGSYEDTNWQYPVIYMHDGQNVFDRADSEKREWHAEEKLNGVHLEAIIIGIEHAGNNRRIDELTPYKNEKHGGGHADDYLDFMVKTLKPYVDAHYRTLPDVRNTTVFGSSVGGLVSFYALLKYPDVFGNAGVFSPSFWFSEEIFGFAESIPTIKGRIYLMAGDHESTQMVPDVERMEVLLLQKVKNKEQVFKKIVHNGHHNEKLWKKEFTEACQWLLR